MERSGEACMGAVRAPQAGGQPLVVTWLGEEVSREVRVKGSVLTFRRKGMTFRGRLRREQDAFGFRRIQ